MAGELRRRPGLRSHSSPMSPVRLRQVLWLALVLSPAVTLAAADATRQPVSHPKTTTSGSSQQVSSSRCSQRLVVGYQPSTKAAVLHQLSSQGYTVISSGPGFLVVVHCKQTTSSSSSSQHTVSSPAAASSLAWWLQSLQAKACTWLVQLLHSSPVAAAACHRAAASSTAQTEPAPGPSTTPAGSQQQQHHHHHHLRRLSAVQGVSSAELDVRRHLLTARLTPSRAAAWDAQLARIRQQQLEQQQQQQQVPTAADSSQQHQEEGRVLAGLPSEVARRLNPVSGSRTWRDWSASQSGDPDPYSPWVPTGCGTKDITLPPAPGQPVGEVVPWGVAAVLTDPNNKGNGSSLPPVLAVSSGLAPSTKDANVIMCLIDSGLYQAHEEYKGAALLPPDGNGGQWPSSKAAAPNNLLTGCGANGTSGGCPFLWSLDDRGHGTHVIGTVAAPRNGRGVVGVVPGGMEVYVVRIWDTNDNVGQGEGVFASDLVRAYERCRGYLKRRQAAEPKRRHRMVINMSFGAPGPLSVEEAYLAQVAATGEVLFVGSAGNNGTGGTDWLSYPGSYPWVVSVANAQCYNGLAITSQRREQVSLAAPGTSVLSAVPPNLGFVRAALALGRPLSPAALAAARPPPGSSSSSNSPWGSGASLLFGGEPEASKSSAAAAAASGVFAEPRPLVATPPGAVGPAPLAACDIKPLLAAYNTAQAVAGGEDALKAGPGCKAAAGGGVCLVALPNQVDSYAEACLAMVSCLKGGGSGVLLYSNNTDDPIWSPFGRELLPRLQVNCGSRCACWAVLQPLISSKFKGVQPPAAVLPAGQGRALAAQLAEDAKAPTQQPRLTAKLTVFDYNYRHFDGTSMAAPHVSGVAARIWAAHPGCTATQVKAALVKGVTPLQGQGGGIGMLNMPLALQALKATGC